MKDLKKMERVDINNAIIYGLGSCVYSGHKPPKHADIEYMTNVLKVFLNEKVEIKLVGYNRDGAGLWAMLQKENGDEITIALKVTNLTVGTKDYDTEKYGFWEIREALEQWLNK